MDPWEKDRWHSKQLHGFGTLGHSQREVASQVEKRRNRNISERDRLKEYQERHQSYTRQYGIYFE